MRMTAEPQGAFARRYQLLADGALITQISLPAFGPSTATPIAGQAVHLRRAGLRHDAFTLEAVATGATLASATREHSLRRDFTVEVGGRQMSLRAESAWRSGYALMEGDRAVGWVRPGATLGRGVEAELPDDLPLTARVFLLWVALLLWRGPRGA